MPEFLANAADKSLFSPASLVPYRPLGFIASSRARLSYALSRRETNQGQIRCGPTRWPPTRWQISPRNRTLRSTGQQDHLRARRGGAAPSDATCAVAIGSRRVPRRARARRRRRVTLLSSQPSYRGVGPLSDSRWRSTQRELTHSNRISISRPPSPLLRRLRAPPPPEPPRLRLRGSRRHTSSVAHASAAA